MSIAAGARLGPYEIVTLIGAGGMGEVYKARDTRLNRTVAIKVLLDRYRDDADRRRRLQREAQAIAVLTHPHICTLYDVGQYEDGDFLVMEYVEGETLASRLLTGPLPLKQLLRYATEIANALDRAHRQGIVHHDLKPGNIMLTKGGVKLLDFGLARLCQAEGTAVTETAKSSTAPGVISGTLPYMAPEQLEGAGGDARTDIFAFGAVLYEMTSGRRAFRGDTPSQLIAAILHQQPEPLASVQPTVPGNLERLIAKCLAKDADARWQSASDLADELRWTAEGGSTDAGALARSPRYHRTRWAAIAITAVLIAAGMAMWRFRGLVRPDSPDPQYQRITSSGDVVMSAISPDGRTVAYVSGIPGGVNRVVVREIGGNESAIWTGDDILGLAWMPDGAHLIVMGNRESRGAWIVPILGGPARRVACCGKFVAPSPDGAALALTQDGSTGFELISLSGGSPRVVNMSGVRTVYAIDWHARTNRVVVMTSSDDKLFSIWSVAPDGRDQLRLHTGNETIRAMCTSPVSDVVYAMVMRRGALDLLRVPMSSNPGGASVLVSGLTDTAMAYRCSVSADGHRLLYGRRSSLSNIWRLDLARSKAQATQLTVGTQNVWHPAVSPDGLWIAATSGAAFAEQLVKIPIGGGEPTGFGEGAGPAWSSDGQRLAFISRRSGSPRVWISGANGQWPQEVKGSDVGDPPPIWLPDGRLAWQTPDRQNYKIRDLLTGRDEYVFPERASGQRMVSDVRFSPRGDRLVLWRRLFPPTSWLISWPNSVEPLAIPGTRPIAWSRDGEWIYMIADRGRSFARASAQTGAIETIGQFPQDLDVHTCDLAPHSDAIICSLTQRRTDAWVMSNFDPGSP